MDKNLSTIKMHYAARVPTLFWGAPGVGKTSAIEAFGRSIGKDVLVPQLRNVEDLCVPVVRHDKDGGTRVEVMPVSEFAEAATRPDIIIFVDELGTLSRSVQNAILRFLDSGKIGSYRIPENIWRVAATNDPSMVESAFYITPTAANRLAHCRWHLDPVQWCNDFVRYWGCVPEIGDVDQDAWLKMRSAIAGFIYKSQSALLDVPKSEVQKSGPWPSPRSWDYGSRLAAIAYAQGADLPDALATVEATVGPPRAMEIVSWAKEITLPDVEEWLSDPEHVMMPRRSDILHAALSEMIQRVVKGNDYERFVAAWKILNQAVELAPDVAAAKAIALAFDRPQEWEIPKSLLRQRIVPVIAKFVDVKL